jgi:O-6-methylguanine DNA methyltransferase
MKYRLFSEFEKAVLKKLEQVPMGRVTTYRNLADAIGKPKAYRAVGNALNKNPNAPDVPCHRVVKSDGALGGYAGGTRRKIRLLRNEGVLIAKGKVADFEKILYEFKEVISK